MSDRNDGLNRRDFVKTTTGLGAAWSAAPVSDAETQAKTGRDRVPGANDRINIGIIGVGLRGSYLAKQFDAIGVRSNACRIVAVCDLYQKRVTKVRNLYHCDGYLDYRQVLERPDVDAVVVAPPDHWHAPIALAALAKGKDIYLEKPMCHTIEETRQVVEAVQRTKRVVQIGSQTTSAEWWWKTRELVAAGAIGKLVMSQGSYHRNSKRNWLNDLWTIDPNAGPDRKGDDFVDWNTFLGPAPKRAWTPERFFRYRKYWDYSGGIATDLFFHVASPLNICWGEAQFPYKVTAGGALFHFDDDDVPAEVPDSFHLIAEYPMGHTMVLSSSMVNSQYIPGTVRGHYGTITMIDNGEFEGNTDHIRLRPEKRAIDDAYKAKFGSEEKTFRVESKIEDLLTATHITNFLECVRSRRKPTLDVETAARSQVLVSMSVQAYRQGRVLYFDEKNWQVLTEPPRSA
jgi:predicted dehydrogenase